MTRPAIRNTGNQVLTPDGHFCYCWKDYHIDMKNDHLTKLLPTRYLYTIWPPAFIHTYTIHICLPLRCAFNNLNIIYADIYTNEFHPVNPINWFILCVLYEFMLCEYYTDKTYSYLWRIECGNDELSL